MTLTTNTTNLFKSFKNLIVRAYTTDSAPYREAFESAPVYDMDGSYFEVPDYTPSDNLRIAMRDAAKTHGVDIIEFIDWLDDCNKRYNGNSSPFAPRNYLAAMDSEWHVRLAISIFE